MTPSKTELLPAFAQLRSAVDSAIELSLNRSFATFGLPPDQRAKEFTRAIDNSLAGGKRFRALSATVGAATTLALGAGKDSNSEDLLGRAATPANLALGAALEMYQAAALIHDDVIDRGSERRGRPATHVEFSEHHQANSWLGDTGHFGTAAAILAGDYLLAAGPYTLESAATGDLGIELRRQFELMTGEVAFGQYLDLRASNMLLDSEFLNTEQIIDIVRLKSARYSVAHPVSLGARQAGATEGVARKLESIFEAAGIAFQLRDDDLGVFGDLDSIGKSASGDVLEKKRTVLLALTYENAPAEAKATLRDVYVSQETASESQVITVREIMGQYGRKAHEEAIDAYRRLAQDRLREASFPPAAESICQAFISLIVDRES